jgi:hypothetical protein
LIHSVSEAKAGWLADVLAMVPTRLTVRDGSGMFMQ